MKTEVAHRQKNCSQVSSFCWQLSSFNILVRLAILTSTSTCIMIDQAEIREPRLTHIPRVWLIAPQAKAYTSSRSRRHQCADLSLGSNPKYFVSTELSSLVAALEECHCLECTLLLIESPGAD